MQAPGCARIWNDQSKEFDARRNRDASRIAITYARRARKEKGFWISDSLHRLHSGALQEPFATFWLSSEWMLADRIRQRLHEPVDGISHLPVGREAFFFRRSTGRKARWRIKPDVNGL